MKNVQEKLNYNNKLKKDKIYHYTNCEALINIIKKNELWLTDRDFMNDTMDRKYVDKLIKKSISEILNEKKYTQEDKRRFKNSIIDKLISVPYEQHVKQYVFSLSNEKDLIHQWAHYGKNDGYCIEFSKSRLSKYFYEANKDQKIIEGNVIYERDYRNIKKYLLNLFEEVPKLTNQKTSIKEEKNIYDNLSIKYKLYALVKQYGNYSEREFRFIVQSSINPEYRGKNGIVTPYIIVSIKKNEKENLPLPIKKIIIGPYNNDKIAKIGLKRFLFEKGYKKVIIEESEMKFRK